MSSVFTLKLNQTKRCPVSFDAGKKPALAVPVITSPCTITSKWSCNFIGLLTRRSSITDQVRYTIRDTGSGFAENELKRVFEPLFRGEMSRNRSTGGSGLGMAILERIIRRHGGELVADNDRRGGALLSGWLPSMN
ncbi:hypothetical protein H7K30_02315 [Paenibacillus illinoisensis]|nr:hypothetical protein [Paenibacillus illinoisensis]